MVKKVLLEQCRRTMIMDQTQLALALTLDNQGYINGYWHGPKYSRNWLIELMER